MQFRKKKMERLENNWNQQTHILNWAVSPTFLFFPGEKCMLNKILFCLLPLRCSLFLAWVIQQL